MKTYEIAITLKPYKIGSLRSTGTHLVFCINARNIDDAQRRIQDFLDSKEEERTFKVTDDSLFGVTEV